MGARTILAFYEMKTSESEETDVGMEKKVPVRGAQIRGTLSIEKTHSFLKLVA